MPQKKEYQNQKFFGSEDTNVLFLLSFRKANESQEAEVHYISHLEETYW